MILKNDTFVSYSYLSLNKIKINNNDIMHFSSTFRVIYTSFFYYRFITQKIHNDSIFHFFSYFPTKYNTDNNFVYYKNNSLVLINRDFNYWSNNYIVCDRYNPYSIKNSFLLENYIKYIYVIIWYYLYYPMVFYFYFFYYFYVND